MRVGHPDLLGVFISIKLSESSKMFSLRLPGEFYPQLFLQDELPAEPV